MCKSNLSALDNREQIDITEVIDKLGSSFGLVTNDSGIGVTAINPEGLYKILSFSVNTLSISLYLDKRLNKTNLYL